MRHFLDNFLTTYDAFESLRIGQKGNKRCDENRLNSGHLDNLSNVRKKFCRRQNRFVSGQVDLPSDKVQLHA